jgi:hypothetical protein
MTELHLGGPAVEPALHPSRSLLHALRAVLSRRPHRKRKEDAMTRRISLIRRVRPLPDRVTNALMLAASLLLPLAIVIASLAG